jgi:hypothetical protein
VPESIHINPPRKGGGRREFRERERETLSGRREGGREGGREGWREKEKARPKLSKRNPETQVIRTQERKPGCKHQACLAFSP